MKLKAARTVAIGLVAAFVSLDRLCLWLEDRGWLYYRRKKPTSSPMSAWVASFSRSWLEEQPTDKLRLLLLAARLYRAVRLRAATPAPSPETA
jgi:hypothetical protein